MSTLDPSSLDVEIDRLEQLQTRANRQFRAAVFFGVAIAALIMAVGYSIYHNQTQDKIIRQITVQSQACRIAPQGEACRLSRIGAIALMSRPEACYVLAQGGLTCADRPLPGIDKMRADLFKPPRLEDQAGTYTPEGGTRLPMGPPR